jgi:hypothetical protein
MGESTEQSMNPMICSSSCAEQFHEGYFQTELKEGWTLVAVQWEREVEGEAQAEAPRVEDVPYGLRVADDCIHLEEDPVKDALWNLCQSSFRAISRMSQIAEELNRQGFRTRLGTAWTQAAVFSMLPRLIEAAPQIWRSIPAQKR